MWSKRTSHLFEAPLINDQGKEVQTTFYDMFSRSSAGRQGGRQFFPRRLAHPGREVVKDFCSEALCKASVWRLKEEVVVTLRYCSDQYINSLETKSSFSGKACSKMDFGYTPKSKCSSLRKIKVQGSSWK